MAAANSLIANVQGLFRDYMMDPDTGLWSLTAAPIMEQDAETGEYNFLSSLKFGSARDPVRDGAFDEQLRRGNVAYGRATVSIVRKIGQYIILPDRWAKALTSTNGGLDVQKDALDTIFNDLLTGHVVDTETAIATLSATAAGSGTLAAGTQNTDLITFFNTVNTEIELATGKRGTHAFLSTPSINALMLNDQVQTGTAISGYASSNTTVRRTGSVDRARVFSFFSDVLGLELVEKRWIRETSTAGTNEYLGALTGHVATMAGSNAMEGPIRTAVQVIGREDQGGLIQVYSNPTILPDAPGTAIGADGMWGVVVTQSARGRKFTVSN